LAGRQALRWGATAVVLGIVAWSFGRVLSDNWDELRGVDVRVNGWTVAAVLLFALAVPVSGLLWGRMTALLSGEPVGRREAVRVQCASWLLKYVPGQVGSVVNKVLWGTGRGIPRTVILVSYVYENAFLIIGSTVPTVAIVLVMTAGGGIGSGIWDVWLAVLAALLLLTLVGSPRLFRMLTNVLVRRVAKRELPAENFLPPAAGLRYQFAFLGPRLMNALGFVCIVQSVVDVSGRDLVALGAIYVLAGAMGIMAVFVPSGLGVRESVIVVLSALFMPVAQAIVLSLLARLYSTVADGVVAVIYGALATARSRERRLT
jgi:hypothetical protein